MISCGENIEKLIEIEKKNYNYDGKEFLIQYFNLFDEQIPFLVENLVYYFGIRPLNHQKLINLIQKIYFNIKNQELFKKLLLILGSKQYPLLIHKLYINFFLIRTIF